MVFEIENKVALITGGASGIGLCFVKELLRNGAKGVAIAHINSQHGERAVEEIETIFGPNKAIFIKTDVTDYKQFEAAFVKTIETFNNVDIVINNAGIVNEIEWEKTILVNINGTVNGIFLAMDKYLPQHKQAEEALIVNISSIGGTFGHGSAPIYCGTKHAIIGLVKSWGNEDFYEETKIRVVGICPGGTITQIFENWGENLREGKYRRYNEKYYQPPTQNPEFVATEAIKVMKWALNGTIWVIENGEPAYEYTPSNISTMKQNTIRCQ